MSARILDGRATAKAIRGELARDAAALKKESGIVPNLTILLVGEHPASKVYVRNKAKASREVGMEGDLRKLPASISQSELLDRVAALNADPSVHGILVQLPLPDHIDAGSVLEAIDPAKDVDGFHPVNAGRLLTGLDARAGFVPCTPAGILEMLRRHDIPIAGREAVVIGRSNIVGKPVALLLLREHATVTLCHSRTPDLAAVASRAEILVCAIGRKALVRGNYIRPGAVVVDVGMNRCTDVDDARDLFGGDSARIAQVREKGYTLVGDVHPAQAMQRAGWFSPVPGGVGPLTIAMLLSNTIEAARRHASRTAATAG